MTENQWGHSVYMATVSLFNTFRMSSPKVNWSIMGLEGCGGALLLDLFITSLGLMMEKGLDGE